MIFVLLDRNMKNILEMVFICKLLEMEWMYHGWELSHRIFFSPLDRNIPFGGFQASANSPWYFSPFSIPSNSFVANVPSYFLLKLPVGNRSALTQLHLRAINDKPINFTASKINSRYEKNAIYFHALFMRTPLRPLYPCSALRSNLPVFVPVSLPPSPADSGVSISDHELPEDNKSKSGNAMTSLSRSMPTDNP